MKRNCTNYTEEKVTPQISIEVDNKKYGYYEYIRRIRKE